MGQSPGVDPGSAGPGGLHGSRQPVEGGVVDERPHPRARVGRIADDELFRRGREPLQHLLADTAVNQNPGAGRTVLPHGQEGGLDHVVDELVAVGERVGHQHLGALAAHLQRDALEVALGGVLEDAAAGRGGPGEGQRPYEGVTGKGRPGFPTVPRQYREHPGGQAGLDCECGQVQGRTRGRLCGLDQQTVTGGQGRSDLPCGHGERVVPRQDRRDDPDRFATHETETVGPARRDAAEDLVGGLGEPADRLDRARYVARTALRDRLARVLAVQPGEDLGVAFHEVGQPPQHRAALPDRQPRPHAGLVDLPGLLGGLGDVVGARGGQSGDRLTGGGVDDVQRLVRGHASSTSSQRPSVRRASPRRRSSSR